MSKFWQYLLSRPLCWIISHLRPHVTSSSSIFSNYNNENYLPVNSTDKAATVTDPTPRVKFLNYEIPIKKNIWWRVCVTHQQSLVAPSSRFFLPRLPGQFETVTLRQHQGLYERKWQEQDVQNISTVSGAVPRLVFLHKPSANMKAKGSCWSFSGFRTSLVPLPRLGEGEQSSLGNESIQVPRNQK